MGITSAQDSIACALFDRGRRDRALLLLGFAGAFRRSELVALNRKDLRTAKEGLEVTIRHTKSNQEGESRKVGIP